MTIDFWSCEEFDAEAQRLYERGEYDAALELLGRGLALYPDSSELWVSRGYTELAREEFAWARRAFEQALALEPDHEDALVGMGEALLKFGERSLAFRVFERVLELGFADDAELLLSIGRALYREGLLERAETYFRRAAGVKGAGAEAAAELGFVLHLRGERAAGRRWLERALGQDPEHHEARACLGNLLYEAAEYRSALSEFLRIPPAEIWDPLTAWRAIELARGFQALAPGPGGIEPLIARLEQLNVEPGPVDRLLAEVTASDAGPGVIGQLDLFCLDSGEDVPEHPPIPREDAGPDVAVDRGPDAPEGRPGPGSERRVTGPGRGGSSLSSEGEG